MNKRKVTAIMLCLSLALGLTACGGNKDALNAQEADGETAQTAPVEEETAQTEPVQDEPVQDETAQTPDAIMQTGPVEDETSPDEIRHDEAIAGGWSANSGALSLDANPEVKAAFEKATEGLTGYGYEPIAYLGSQVVAGTNYRILCRASAVVPDAAPAYEIVTIYEDLDGAAVITESVAVPGVPEEVEGLDGGWTVNAADFTPEANPDAKAALETATGNLLGVGYEPIAFLASQVVAGTNYKMFCRTTPVIPDAEPFFTVVTVYADLDGNAEVTDVTNVDFS